MLTEKEKSKEGGGKERRGQGTGQVECQLLNVSYWVIHLGGKNASTPVGNERPIPLFFHDHTTPQL